MDAIGISEWLKGYASGIYTAASGIEGLAKCLERKDADPITIDELDKVLRPEGIERGADVIL